MAKDASCKMDSLFASYLNEGEAFEYYLLGEIAPSTKESWILGAIVLAVALVADYFLKFNLFYVLIAVMVILFVVLNLIIKNVYMAKVGKRLYVCESDLFGFSKKVEIIPLRNVVYYKEAGFDKETILELPIEGNVRKVTLKNKPRHFKEQKQVIEQFLQDVDKKRK